MSTPHILEPFDFSNLTADKPAVAANQHATTARKILEGKADAPAAPDISPLPNLYNTAIMAVRGAAAAQSDLEAAVAESNAAAVHLETVLGDRHEGLSDADASAAMRAARDREDLAGLHVRRARSVLDQVKGHRRKALAELGAAVEEAALTTATLAAVRTIADLEAGIDAALRERFHAEVERSIDALALMSGATATIGGRAELLHGRIRDLRQDDPSAAAIAYFLKTCFELIQLMTPPAPAAELPIDPILEGIVEAKPRRARKAA